MGPDSARTTHPPASDKAEAERTASWSWEFWLPRALIIVAATLWIYWPALNGAFVWDDGWYIETNPLLHDGGGLWKFWFQPGRWVEYYPIHETLLWVQYQIWGNQPLGYHLTNVLLHTVNALLVWRVLEKFGLKYAWVGGLIFAVHPVQVESVAWISELKNTLSLPFFLVAICQWMDYEDQKRKDYYYTALGLFLIAMLCKITMALFPVVILLYAWWKRGRVQWGDFAAALPFFIISAALGVLTIWVGSEYRAFSHAQPEHIPIGGVLARIDNAGLIFSVYFARCFLPGDVLLTYPQWTVDPRSLLQYAPWVLFLIAFGWLWKRRHGWGKHVLLGLGFFLINLVPFLGLTAVSYMSFTWVMDHFLYLPIVGLIGLVVAGMGDFEERFPTDRPYLTGVMTIGIALMTIESHAFSKLFINEETLWGYILQRNPNVWLAHHQLGCNLLDRGRYSEAYPHLREVVRLNPEYSDGYYNLGIILGKMGQAAAAQDQYRQALKLNPYDDKSYINLADSLLLEGKSSEAIQLYQQALPLIPDVVAIHYNLGVALQQSGQLPAAIEQFGIVVKLDPKLLQARVNLGTVYAESGALPEAITEFEAAQRIDPNYLAARGNLALALAQSGRIQEAIVQYEELLRRDPNYPEARADLAKLQKYLLKNPPGK